MNFRLCDFILKIIYTFPASLMSDLGEYKPCIQPRWPGLCLWHAMRYGIKRAPLWAAKSQIKIDGSWVSSGEANRFS